jgi:hypothetical protein
MATPIVIVGSLVVIFGAVIWAFRPPSGAGKTTIRLPGFEISLDVPALAVMAVGVVLVVIGTAPPPEPSPSSGPSPSLGPSPPTLPVAERCYDFTGTYGVYANGSGKASIACQGGACKLSNGSRRATLVPSPTGIHSWIVPEWNLTARDRESCMEIQFIPNGTIWKKE